MNLLQIFEGVASCKKTETLYTIMERIVNAEVSKSSLHYPVMQKQKPMWSGLFMMGLIQGLILLRIVLVISIVLQVAFS